MSLNKSINPYQTIERKPLLTQVFTVLLFLVIIKYLFSLIVWQFAGPISLLSGFLLVLNFNRKNNVGWKEIGFKSDKWVKTVLWCLASLILAFFVIIIAKNIADLFFDKLPRENVRFGDLEGNFSLTLFWVVLGVLVGGFGEEIVYRGFFVNALERVINNKFKVVIAIILPALFWAVRHYYFSGGHGSITVFFIGLFFGVIYIISGRNLWPVIIVHSLFDSASFIMRFYGY